jgi:hypothetical protein
MEGYGSFSPNLLKAKYYADNGMMEDTVHLRYQDKKYDDITRISAIAITDDRICLIDEAAL